MKTKLFLLSLVLLAATCGYAQTFEVPKHYEFKVKEDYAPYEKDIIAAAGWLIQTPLNEQAEKRKEVSAFVMQWVNGSPTVNVEINQVIMDMESANPGMLMIYMAASAKYVLENNYAKDMRPKHKYALQQMIAVYKSGKGIQKDKNMDALVKADSKGDLEKWMDKNFGDMYK